MTEVDGVKRPANAASTGVDVISGGPTTGDTGSARKSYARGGSSGNRESGRFGPEETVTFSFEDDVPDQYPQDDPLLISLQISSYLVKRVYVDNGSSANVLYYDTFTKMQLSLSDLAPVRTQLHGFTGHAIQPEGQIRLQIRAGSGATVKVVTVTFVIVKASSAYNAILGRPGLNALRAITSTHHLMMKFPTPGGVATIRGDQATARHCYMASIKGKNVAETMVIDTLQPPHKYESESRLETDDLVELFELDSKFPDRKLKVGSALPAELKKSLTDLLVEYQDVFAWSAADMPGVPRSIIEHRLNVNPSHRPVKQKKRSFAPERSSVIDQETDKLIDAGMAREVDYPTWLANPVVVKKANGEPRMCIDFTSLNKACPKDSFPLPRIDMMVDAIVGYELLCFLDAYKGYHQIFLAEEDQEKTAFITNKGTFCFITMPFGLKNAGATYQRLAAKLFEHQSGRNVEVYVDDMLVKSRTQADLTVDLRETFDVLRQSRMKLNPAKCTFGVSSGKFLGFMVSERGIEVNPAKVQAILDMHPPRSVKEVQRLTGRIASLNRFLSKAAERSLPFFAKLKKSPTFEWTEDCQSAFDELKAHLQQLPRLTIPLPGDRLVLYLAASEYAVSSVLLREEGPAQHPIYYVSKTLQGAEQRYPLVEKLALSLLMSARKLRPYFQAHSIQVVTDQPLKHILGNPNVSGRLTKWAMELGEFDISYEPRTAIKAQALADFIAESNRMETDIQQPIAELGAAVSTSAPWTLFVDGASNMDGSGAGLLLIGPDGDSYTYALRFTFPATNNEAEYEALLAGLNLAKQMGITDLQVCSDSQLVVCQIQGAYEAKDPTMIKYLDKVKHMLESFKSCKIKRIPRSQNKNADALSKLASSVYQHLTKSVLVETLSKRSIEEDESMCIDVESSWTDPIRAYLSSGELPRNSATARKVRMQSAKYQICDGILYRKSYLGPLLRCLTPQEAEYAVAETHEGICGSHIGVSSLVKKLLLVGYYWPSMQKDAEHYIRKCEKCQVHAHIPRRPGTELTTITSPWPFSQWGIDLVGPFPKAPGGYSYLVVAVDYFTKWVEAEPLVTISEKAVQRFFLKNIICRFGIPYMLISDNGTQFEGSLERLCGDLNIKKWFSSVAHPQANGQVELSNRTILHGLKTRLDKAKGLWVDELPYVLWSLRTTANSATRFTPFSLTYGAEAVLPVEVEVPSIRTHQFRPQENPQNLLLSLDMVEGRRATAAARQLAYQQKIAAYYNKRVRGRYFRPGDLVLRKNEASRVQGTKKLDPNWEGPYTIIEARSTGSYKLAELDGRLIPRYWNVSNLRKFHV